MAGTMRAVVAAFLLLTARGIGAIAVETELACLESDHQELADQALCGDNGSLNYCLGLSPALSQIGSCFVNAGCSEEESSLEIERLLDACVNGELKKRTRRPLTGRADHTSAAPEPKTTAEKPAPTALTQDLVTSTPQDASSTDAAASNTPTDTPTDSATDNAASTTADSATATQTPQSDASSSPSSATEAAVTITVTSSLSTFTGSLTTPIVCLTSSSIDVTVCPTQSTGTASGSRLSCYPTNVPVQTCAAGLLCQTDTNGAVSCLVKDDSISAGGIIVASVFAFVLFGAIGLMLYYSCRERAARRRHAAAEEAALIAREAKKARDGKRPGVGVRSVSAHSAVGDTGYGGGRAASGPYSDAAPLMHNVQSMGSSTVVQSVGQDPFADQYHPR